MTDFKITLACTPNTTGIADKIAPYEHLGLAYLASILRKNNYNVQIIDSDALKIKLNDVVEKILDFNPDLLALSPTWATVHNSIAIIERLKEKNPDLHTCFGGYTATFNDIEILEDYPILDYVIRGEGEKTLLNLVEFIEKNNSIYEILGITTRNNKNKIIQNPIDSYIKDLDMIPFPARDTFKEILKTDNVYILNMITSRGCYGNCSFCIAGAFSRLCKETAAWRCRSIENVIDELKLLLNEFPQIHYINFADNNIFGPGKAGIRRVKRLAQAIIDLDIGVEWHASARADNFNAEDDELFELLKSSKIGTLFIGIESGVQSQLDLFNKHLTVSRNLKTIKLINEWKIPVQWGFIQFNPYVTFDELIQNANFYFDELQYYSIHKMCMKLRVFSGTKLYKKIKEDNLLKDDYNYVNIFNYNYFDKRVEMTEDIMTNTANQLYKEHAIIQNAEEMSDQLLSKIISIEMPHDIASLQDIVKKRNRIYAMISDINNQNYQYFRNIIDLIKTHHKRTKLELISELGNNMMEEHVLEIKKRADKLDIEFNSYIKSLNIYMHEILDE